MNLRNAYLDMTEYLLHSWLGESGSLREQAGAARDWEEMEELLSGWVEAHAGEIARREAAALTEVGGETEHILRRACGTDLGWMESYGLPVTVEERALARFLYQYPARRLREMGEHIVQALLHGFVSQSRDRRARKLVRLSCCLGQEALAQEVLRSLEERGLRGIVQKPQCLTWTGTYAMAHAADQAACLSEGALDALLEAYRQAFEERADALRDTCGMIGIGQFGEAAGVPGARPGAYEPPPERRQRLLRFADAKRELEARYLAPSDLSFCKVAYPNLLVGENFPAVFDAFYQLNTMDSQRYELIQQTIIDALDTCERVELKGAGDNRTDLTVRLGALKDPERETNFLNCGGDLNIPHGELFTTPRLEGTNGVLHVKDIYLKGVYFKDLILRFENGIIINYGCGGCESEAAGRDYVREHLFQGNDTLPVGEFAIGSNTLAYAIARDMDLVSRMPILLAEKMGPHIAVGDPCFARGEDAPVYNLYDGKEMVARENERTARRGGDEPVYTNIHTDITLAFDELERLEGVRADGGRVPVLKDGRFVLAGTEPLNEPLMRRENQP